MGFPLPSGEEDKGRGCVLPPLPSSQTPVLCRERVPLRSCRPALPQGEQNSGFWAIGRFGTIAGGQTCTYL